MAVTGKHVDDSVEVAMFHVEFDNTALDLLDVDHIGHFQLVVSVTACNYSTNQCIV
jgi:hypothetical protein